MTTDEFWQMVERAHRASGGDMKRKCELVAAELEKLSPSEIELFDEQFTDYYYRLYSWDVWGAAYLITKGCCGDDSFMDFRTSLISRGRGPVEAALTNPDLLAEFDFDPEEARFEGYSYPISKVYEQKTGNELPRSKRHPRHPSGKEFLEWEMSVRYPRLAAKCGHDDSKYAHLSEREKKAQNDTVTARHVMEIMLNAGMVASNGLIPPPRIVMKILKAGESPKGSAHQHKWAPFEFDEGHYWRATQLLAHERDLSARPDLKGVKITVDTEAPRVEEFEEWLRRQV